ncbi:hypothetical protein Pelo_14381 [Pelomyxa schiedti]|nr:hypothetical protein Pelo_14381 [Pelomyxa schiedti]
MAEAAAPPSRGVFRPCGPTATKTRQAEGPAAPASPAPAHQHYYYAPLTALGQQQHPQLCKFNLPARPSELVSPAKRYRVEETAEPTPHITQTNSPNSVSPPPYHQLLSGKVQPQQDSAVEQNQNDVSGARTAPPVAPLPNTMPQPAWRHRFGPTATGEKYGDIPEIPAALPATPLLNTQTGQHPSTFITVLEQFSTSPSSFSSNSSSTNTDSVPPPSLPLDTVQKETIPPSQLVEPKQLQDQLQQIQQQIQKLQSRLPPLQTVSEDVPKEDSAVNTPSEDKDSISSKEFSRISGASKKGDKYLFTESKNSRASHQSSASTAQAFCGVPGAGDSTASIGCSCSARGFSEKPASSKSENRIGMKRKKKVPSGEKILKYKLRLLELKQQYKIHELQKDLIAQCGTLLELPAVRDKTAITTTTAESCTPLTSNKGTATENPQAPEKSNILRTSDSMMTEFRVTEPWGDCSALVEVVDPPQVRPGEYDLGKMTAEAMKTSGIGKKVLFMWPITILPCSPPWTPQGVKPVRLKAATKRAPFELQCYEYIKEICRQVKTHHLIDIRARSPFKIEFRVGDAHVRGLLDQGLAPFMESRTHGHEVFRNLQFVVEDQSGNGSTTQGQLSIFSTHLMAVRQQYDLGPFIAADFSKPVPLANSLRKSGVKSEAGVTFSYVDSNGQHPAGTMNSKDASMWFAYFMSETAGTEPGAIPTYAHFFNPHKQLNIDCGATNTTAIHSVTSTAAPSQSHGPLDTHADDGADAQGDANVSEDDEDEPGEGDDADDEDEPSMGDDEDETSEGHDEPSEGNDNDRDAETPSSDSSS